MTSNGILAFSDCHVGPGFYLNKADDFGPVGGWQENALITLCCNAKRDGLTTVSLGDLIEAIQFYFGHVLTARREFWRALFEVLDYIVVGNHDEFLLWKGIESYIKDILNLKKLPKIVKSLKLGKTWIEHAHDHDPHISNWPRMWKVVTKVVGVLERRWPDIDVKGEKFLSWLGGTGRHSSNDKYMIPAARVAHRCGCDIVIIGHTHEQAAYEPAWPFGPSLTPPICFYNTGTRTGGRTDSVRIER